AGRRPAIRPIYDLPIGAAHTERERAHQDRAVGFRRLRYVLDAGRIGDAGRNREGAHAFNLAKTVRCAAASARAHCDETLVSEQSSGLRNWDARCAVTSNQWHGTAPLSDRDRTHTTIRDGDWRQRYMATIGQTHWAIAEGYIPSQSSFTDPALISHETACILNAGDTPAHIRITVFFADRDPVGPYLVTVEP